MKKPEIKIDIVSDVVCPWCYIGKRRLEKAIENLSDKFIFHIEFHPFELNPGMPAKGLDQKKYLTEKFGGPERYDKIKQHVTKIAASEGLNFQFDKQLVLPNTRNMHRIILMAKEVSKQADVKEAFLKAYFIDGVDLSKIENLTEVATQAGLDRETITELLSGNNFEDEVIMAEQTFQKLGVSGVPFYIIQDKYGVSGAQPTEIFEKAIEEVASQ